MVYLSTLPITFSLVVSLLTKRNEKDTKQPCSVLRKWFCEAVWLDNELKGQDFRDGLSIGDGRAAAVWGAVSGALEWFSLLPEPWATLGGAYNPRDKCRERERGWVGGEMFIAVTLLIK